MGPATKKQPDLSLNMPFIIEDYIAQYYYFFPDKAVMTSHQRPALMKALPVHKMLEVLQKIKAMFYHLLTFGMTSIFFHKKCGCLAVLPGGTQQHKRDDTIFPVG